MVARKEVLQVSKKVGGFIFVNTKRSGFFVSAKRSWKFQRGLVFEGISKVFDIACWKLVGKQTSIMKALEVAS